MKKDLPSQGEKDKLITRQVARKGKLLMKKRLSCGFLISALIFCFFSTSVKAANPTISQADQPAQTISAVQDNQNAQAGPVPISAYSRLKAGLPVRIAILGDSIGAGADTDPAHAWYALLSSWLTESYGSPITMDNYSIGGTTSLTGYFQSETVLRQNIQSNGCYDLIVICYGANDDPENFSLFYESMLRSVKTQNESCQIITFLESNLIGYSQKTDEICRLSKLYGADVADMIQTYENSGIPYEELSPDGTHPNTEGHYLYFETIRSIIEENAAKDKNIVPLPGASNKYTALFEDFTFIPLQDCLQEDGSYYFTTSLPALGIVYQKSPENGCIHLTLGTGANWEGSAYDPSPQPWMTTAPVGLVFPSGTAVSLNNTDGHIEDTVLGFFASGRIPTVTR